MRTSSTKTRRRTKTRTRIGSSRRSISRAACLGIAAACCLLAEKPARRAPADSAAVVAVSVFREPGFALTGAEIQLAPGPDDKGSPKIRKLKGTTDARGEFVFHVLPGPAQYEVSVSAKGLKPQQKSVRVEGEERVDVTFMLEQESKQ